MMFQSILEIGLGALFAVGAIFNGLYTMSHIEEFFGSFAENAMFNLSRNFVRGFVIPNGKLFTGALITFQLVVAFTILSRGEYVSIGLLAGAVFCFLSALVSNVPGAIANLLLGFVSLFLASAT